MKKTTVLLLVLLVLASCKAKPKPALASYTPVLAQLAANPKAKPGAAAETKDSSTFTYPPAPGLKKLVLVVAKDRAKAWHISLESTEKLSPYNFAPLVVLPKTISSTPTDWFELTDGPLQGNVVHLPGFTSGQGTTAEVFSPDFFLTTLFAFEEPQMMRWACDTGAATPAKGVVPVAVDPFLDQCKNAVRARLSLPDTADFHSFGISHQVATANDCTHAWRSDVESKNAFGVVIKHDFTCVSTKKGTIEVSLK